MIPTPRFYVFCNGGAQKESRQKMRLSDSFIVPDKSGDFEWTAIILNVNLSGGESLVKTCRPLYDYSRFVAKVREESKNGRPSRAEMEKAVDWAIKENLLDGFFVRQKAEVLGMILEEFNREIYEKNVREDGYLEGIEDGREEKAIEAARNALAMNLTAEQAAQITGLPLEQVLELQKELVAQAAN